MGNNLVTKEAGFEDSPTGSMNKKKQSTPIPEVTLNGTSVETYATPNASYGSTPRVESAKCLTCRFASEPPGIEDLAFVASQIGWPDEWVKILKNMHHALVSSQSVTPSTTRGSCGVSKFQMPDFDSAMSTPMTTESCHSTLAKGVLRSNCEPSNCPSNISFPNGPAPPIPPPPPPPPPPPADLPLMSTPTLKKPPVQPFQTPQSRVVITNEELKKIVLRKVTDRPPLPRMTKSQTHLTPMVTLDQLRAVKLRKRGSSQCITSPTRSPKTRDRIKKLGVTKSPRRWMNKSRHDAIPLSTILNFDMELG